MAQEDSGPVNVVAAAEKMAAEFFEALELLYVQVGEPPLRTVAARSPRLSPSNLSDLFSGRRKALPGHEVTTELVKALLHGAPVTDVKQALKEWHERWTKVRTAQRRAEKAMAGQRPSTTGTAEDIIAEATAQARQAAEKIVATAQAEARQIVRESRQLAEEADTAARADAAALIQQMPDHIRDGAKATAERFAAAAAQLSDDAATARLTGVYALARIADDSEHHRRACLELLCAYLRTAYGS